MFGFAIQRRGALAVMSATGTICILMSSSHAPGQAQLLMDPGFEAGAAGAPSAAGGDVGTSVSGPWSGWNNWGAPYSGFYTQAVARTGAQSGKTYSGPNGGVYQSVAVTGGEDYTASAWFDDLSTDAMNSGETDDVRITFYSGPNGTGNVVSGPIISPQFTGTQQNVWTQESVSGVAPLSAQSVTWLAFFNDPAYAGGALYVDDASFTDTSWNGGGTTNNWSDPNNWGGVAPIQYTPLVFSGTTQLTTNNDNPPGTPFYGINFSPTAGPFVLNGNQANLAADVVNNSTSLQTINLNLGMQQNTNFNTAAGNITVNGVISGAFSVIKQGPNTLTLAGSNTYTGPTNIVAGTVVVASAGALPAGNDLLIAANSSLVADDLGAPVGLSVGSLSVLGKLDLNNNALVVHRSNIAAVTALVQSGYNNGAWNGATGIVSTAAATNPKLVTALGVISNDNGSGTPLYGSGGTIASTFDGAVPVDGDVLVKYTYYGDTNLDGKVDGTDYSRIDAAVLANQGAPGSATGWYNGDFNYDGVIDGSDYTLIDNAFNTQGAQLSGEIDSPTAEIAGVIGSTSVPEPAVPALLGVAAVGLLGRGRRRSALQDGTSRLVAKSKMDGPRPITRFPTISLTSLGPAVESSM